MSRLKMIKPDIIEGGPPPQAANNNESDFFTQKLPAYAPGQSIYEQAA
jgi:hypothetical protein